jgi:hypothetical protein
VFYKIKSEKAFNSDRRYVAVPALAFPAGWQPPDGGDVSFHNSSEPAAAEIIMSEPWPW